MCAYKNTGYGFVTYDYASSFILTHAVFIDNHYSSGTLIAKEEDLKNVTIEYTKYYGNGNLS